VHDILSMAVLLEHVFVAVADPVSVLAVAVFRAVAVRCLVAVTEPVVAVTVAEGYGRQLATD